MVGKIQFTLDPFIDRRSSRFQLRERVFNTTIKQTGQFETSQELMTALEEGLREAVQNVIQQDTEAQEYDRLYFNIASSRLKYNYGSWGLTVKRWKEDEKAIEEGFKHMVSALNSNESFTLDDSFTVSITRSRPPVLGSGKAQPIKPGHKDSEVLVDRKKSIVKIKNFDDKCCARSLVVAMAIHENHEKLKQIKRGNNIQEDLAVELHYAARVPFGPCGIEELRKFQQALPNYRIVMVNVKENHQCIPFGEEGKPILAIEYNLGHFHTITSLKGYFQTSYFCESCLKGYQDETLHHCHGRTCFACKQNDCTDFSKKKKPYLHCEECNRWFYGETCFQNHQIFNRKQEEDVDNPICATIKRCPVCCKLERCEKDVDKHQCNHSKCKSCGKYVDQTTHQCFIQTGRKENKRPPKDTEIIMFDIEATQIAGEHKANLIVAETMSSNEQHTFYDLRSFINWVDEVAQDGQVNVTVIAHNLQGYDGYFVVHEYYDSDQKIEQIDSVTALRFFTLVKILSE